MLNLRSVTDLASASIRSSLSGSNTFEVETHLHVSARHVRVAAWGSTLELAWRAHEAQGTDLLPGFEHDLLVTATPTIVFGSVVTAIDLCASAGAFWCGQLKRHGHYFDTGDFTEWTGARKAEPPFPLPVWFDQWLNGLASDPYWPVVRSYRDHQLHRIQSRSVAIGMPFIPSTLIIGGHAVAPEPAPPPPLPSFEQFGPQIDPGEPSVHDEYNAEVTLAHNHWVAFWQALAANA